MDAEPKFCSKCRADVTSAAASGAIICPACGERLDARSSIEPNSAAASRPGRLWLFWLMLVGPSALILLMVALMKAGVDKNIAGPLLGYSGFALGIVGPFYCSYWLSKRIAGNRWWGAVLAIFLAAGLLLVNYMIAVEGCIFIPRHF